MDRTTRRVFCAVTAVSADAPCTPQRANAFRSAWMPAPPPESEPAIVSAAGLAFTRAPFAAGRLRGRAGREVAASGKIE